MPGIALSGKAPVVPTFDVWESWNGLHMNSNSPIATQADFRSGVWPNVSPTNSILLQSNLGATGAVGFNAAIGRSIQSWASAAASTGNGSSATGAFVVPIGRLFSLAGAISPAFLPPLRKYRADFLGRMTVVGTSEMVCGLGMDIAALVNGNQPACMWSSRPGTNAGRWMPRYRLVTAGAILDGPDSGVSASGAAFHQLSVEYTEGLIPTISWLIDGREVFRLTGDGQMPTVPVASTIGFMLTKGLSAPVGTTVEYAETRFRVQEV